MSPIAVLYGGPSPEHDVSILTGLQAAHALVRAGREVEGIYWSKAGEWFAVEPTLERDAFQDGVPRKARPLQLVAEPGGGFVLEGGLGRRRPFPVEAVVNCCHGGPGEDGTLQGALDVAGIPYTGPSARGAWLGMDKLAFGAVVAGAGLPSLPRALLVPGNPPPFPGPYIVKPRFGGSSIGIALVEDFATAEALVMQDASPHLRLGGILEPYRADAHDLNVAVRTYPSLQLSAIERPLRSGSGQILGYEDKYVGGEGMASAPRQLPADLPANAEAHLRDLATRVAELTGVRGVARIDFLAEGDEVWVNEINTIPGSLAKYLWVEPDLPFATLLLDLVAEAADRPAVRYTTAGADGSALRAAGTIASKLA